MYTLSGGTIVERFPFSWSSCGTLLAESIPFYHAYPGTRCLSIGTYSCNFRCKYCSNAFIAKEDPKIHRGSMHHIPARKLVDIAKKLNCHTIIFNINEPTVSLPSLLEVAREAQVADIPMGCLTNGYTTEESAELLVSAFSFFNVSLKGLSSAFSKRYIGIGTSGPVLRNIRRLARDRHVEVTTPVVQGANDNEIDAIADFIASVDPEIPWHVFRLLPEDEMKDSKYPDIETINTALKSARTRLAYIYFHNFVGSEWVNTLCPSCGAVVIERFSLGCGGDRLNRIVCEGDRCPSCGRSINIFGKQSRSGDIKGVFHS